MIIWKPIDSSELKNESWYLISNGDCWDACWYDCEHFPDRNFEPTHYTEINLPEMDDE